MSHTLNSSISHKIARRLLGARRYTNRVGTFRQKEFYGLIDRPNYAYGLLRAADTALYRAKEHGKDRSTAASLEDARIPAYPALSS